MKEYAEIIVDISHEKLDRPFTYRVPEELASELLPGSVVRIPFGKADRLILGYVIGFSDHTDLPQEKLRSIASVEAGKETAESRLIALAAWMSRNCGSSMIQALKTVLPVRRQYVEVTEKLVSLAKPEEAGAYLEVCVRKKWKARERVIRLLAENGTMSAGALAKEASVPGKLIDGLRETGVLAVLEEGSFRRVVRETGSCRIDELSETQAEAVRDIRAEWREKDRPVLLRGVTGSGKTAVYTELIADILEEGKQAIVLVPEIALTAQTVQRFVRRFGDKVSFMHSRLSGGERYDQMKAAKSGSISVMVGPRSALFTPFQRLGLIVIDEEHEESYHSEQTPRYHARETAAKRAELEHAHLIMGSATPSITAQYRAEMGEYREVVLPGRYGGRKLPRVEIVDMRQELADGNRTIISRALFKAAEEALDRGEQVMLFLNRRGFTGCVTCRSCGSVIRCPHCDVSMTLHRQRLMVCHYCGYEQPEVKKCPVCGSASIGGITVGTEQVEELAARLFPGKRVLRMDADTTRGKEGHEKILADFASGAADLLVGTQMIVKGHDFPNVTLVGVLLADLSLGESDYRSSEHTFAMLAQAVGRAGRGTKPGRAVIQTYQPKHYAVEAASRQDTEAFYRQEISYRRILAYPPVGVMCAIYGSAPDEELLGTGMHFIRKYIERIDPNGCLMPIGPAPQAIGKIRDQFRQVIYIRHGSREVLVKAIQKIGDYIAVNRGFDRIRIQFDLT